MSRSATAPEPDGAEESEPEPRTVKARVSDPELLEKFEEAEEDSSMAAVVRDALRMSLLNDDGDDPAQRHVAMPNRAMLREAYRNLVGIADIHIEGAGLRVMKGRVIDNLYSNNTPKADVMNALVEPLVEQGFANLDKGWDDTWVTVRPLAPEPSDPADCALCGAEDVPVFLTDHAHPVGRNFAACAGCHSVTEVDDV